MTTIFYIEDSPVERQLIKRILAPHYTVVLAGDGLEAAQQGKHLKPDLVLTDLNMPGLDGYELATKLKAAWPDVPIVALTGDDTEAARRLALIAGCNGRLTKPIAPQALLDAVKKYLSGYTETLPDTPQLAQEKQAYQQRLVSRLEAQILALTQTNRQLTAVQTITQVITQTLKLNEIIENALDKLLTILELNALAVLLVNRDTNELTLGGQRNFKPAYLERITGSLPGQHLAETIAGAITNRTPRHVVGFAPVSASQPASPGRAPAGICSRASFPLLVNDDVLGVLHVESNKNYAIDDDELHSLELISQQLALAIGKAQLYADLQAAYKDLQQLDDMKSRFIMIASHELRTPLTILMGYAFLLQRQPAEMRREMVATIIEQAEVLKALVDRFLEVERLEQQDFWLDVVDVDLSQAVQTIVNTLKPLAADKTLTLTFTPLPAPHRVWIDPLKFEAILTNVLANAVQFTPVGGRITVTVAVTPPTFEVSVTDTGIGIPKAEHKRIFNKFYQVQKPLKRKHGGAGLGLSIAREMAHLCGGTITLQSTPGAGAVFTYRQPIRSADPRP